MKPYRRAATSVGLLALAGLGGVHRRRHAPRERGRPPRRSDHQGQPPSRHHRPVRLQVGRRDDARPERQSADEPGRQEDGPVRLRARCTRSTSTRNLDPYADIAYRVKFGNTRTLSDGNVVQDYTIKRATGASARTNGWAGTTVARGTTTTYKRTPSGSPTSSAAARPSPARATIRSSSTCRASSSSRSSSSPARPTWASSSVASPASTPSRAPTSARSPSKSRTPASVAPARPSASGRPVLSGPAAATSQVERMGRPAINTVFNNTERREGSRQPARARAMTARSTGQRPRRPDAIGNVLDANGAPRTTPAQKNGASPTSSCRTA